MNFSRFMIVLSLLFAVACANKNCREIRLEDEQKKTGAGQIQNEKKILEASLNKVGPQARVKVFKYDGSRQCGMEEATPLEKMQQQLKDIKTYKQENLSDGLMRIQACGTPTGRANVYEIDRKDLPAAKKIGFKEWIY